MNIQLTSQSTGTVVCNCNLFTVLYCHMAWR